jgi:hypothetical protein
MAKLAYPSACLASIVTSKKHAKGIRANWDWVTTDKAQERLSELYGSKNKVSMGDSYEVTVDFGKTAVEDYPVNLKTVLYEPGSREGFYKIASSATLYENSNGGLLAHSLDWPQVKQYFDIIKPYLYHHNETLKKDIEPVLSPISELKTGYLIFAANAGTHSEKFGSLVNGGKISISKQIEDDGVADGLSDLFCLNVGRPLTTKRDLQLLRNKGKFDARLDYAYGGESPRQNTLFLRKDAFKQTNYIGITSPAYEWSTDLANTTRLDLILPLI